MMINNILLAGLSFWSLYMFAESSEKLKLYWFYYKYMPVAQRPRHKYLNKQYISIWSEHALITMLYWFQCYKIMNVQKSLT